MTVSFDLFVVVELFAESKIRSRMMLKEKSSEQVGLGGKEGITQSDGDGDGGVGGEVDRDENTIHEDDEDENEVVEDDEDDEDGGWGWGVKE
jgi:hypothetical protein